MGATGSVQSIDRVLDIIERLSAAPLGLSLSDLAAATGLHISTAHRLGNVLAERGYAQKDTTSGKYRLTLRLFEVGSRVSGIWDLLTMAKPFLDELAALTQETVHLVERDGNTVAYLYKVEPFHHLVRMGSQVGQRSPMYCTGVGKSILSLLPAGEVEKIWNATEICRYTPTTITELPAMMKELALSRERGYAIDDEEHETGVRCIAAAIRNWSGSPVAAISVSAPAARMDPDTLEKIRPHLIHATDEISRMMGQVF